MGGSGGGGRGFSADDLKRLEQIAKDKLKPAKEESPPERRNVFISFASEDMSEVNLLRGQAKNEKSDLEFIDRSLKDPFDSKNVEYIQRGIRERIRQSSVTVCFLSSNSAKSKWVDWEIRESIKLGKGVIAMYKGDRPPSKVPAAIKEHKIKLLPWNHKIIATAIDKAAKKRS